MGKKLERGPKHGKEMTLGEVAAFVLEAQDNGHGNAQKVFARGSWGGGIKSISVDDDEIVKPTGSARFKVEPEPEPQP